MLMLNLVANRHRFWVSGLPMFDNLSMNAGFLRVASPAWKRYGDILDQTSIEETSYWVAEDGSKNSLGKWTTCRSAGETVHYADNSSGDSSIIRRTADYAYKLVRKEGASEFQIQQLSATEDLQASSLIQRILKRSSYPDFLCRDSLLDAIEKPYFELLSVEHEPTEVYPNLFRVAFDYKHPFRKSEGDYQYNWVQNGTMWLDGDNHWVMTHCQVEFLGARGERSLSEITYEFTEDLHQGVRLPTQLTQHFEMKSGWVRNPEEEYHVSKFRRVPFDSLDSETMTLSYHGFSEPDFSPLDKLPFLEIAFADEKMRFPPSERVVLHATLRNSSEQPMRIMRLDAC